MEKAEKIIDKQKHLAAFLEMGKVMEAFPELLLAVHTKDKERWIKMKSLILYGGSQSFKEYVKN